MRVLVVRPRASGGLAAHVDQELAELTEAGWTVSEAPVTIQERPHLLADLRTVRTLHHLQRRAGEAVAVHAHGLRAGALAALARPRGDGGRLVVTLHNRTVGSRATRALGALLLRVLCRRADVVLAVSPDLAEDARRAGAREVSHAVVPAPERARAQVPATPRRGERLEVLVIARLAPQKGLEDLLDAAALLRRGAPLRIRVAGDGPLHEQLAARIDAEQLPVQLLGRREDVPALLARADLVVSAAHWEGQPVSLQEALRAGRAIVATDAGGTRWVLGRAAQLVPVGDPSALAAAIEAHRDPAVRRHAEDAARERARDLPTAEDLLTQLAAVLAIPDPIGDDGVG
ncbi:glycosyltransferase [Brachybacterium sp. YJGR34]|uniref:glycosyltransferase n=1 Tax=Brachybacterium sp. YJGR34 TaxID=2059911 RepID=UPI000E0C4E52|nr:glycosyltransferase [Brachybacterium sp. YJGR34]